MADDVFLETVRRLRADTVTDGVLDDLKAEVVWRELLLRRLRDRIQHAALMSRDRTFCDELLALIDGKGRM